MTILVGMLFVVACAAFWRAVSGGRRAHETFLSDQPQAAGASAPPLAAARNLASLPAAEKDDGAIEPKDSESAPDTESSAAPAEEGAAAGYLADAAPVPGRPFAPMRSAGSPARSDRSLPEDWEPSKKVPDPETYGGAWFGAGSHGGGTASGAAGDSGGGNVEPPATFPGKAWAAASSGGTFYGTTASGYHANVTIGAPLSEIGGVTGAGYRFQVNIGAQGN